MHSILESDGVPSDPYEVLCHMGTLIIEGRTPKPVSDACAPSETGAKSAKPYNEGPHCPNFMKLCNKDAHNIHKCAANNIFCIRYNNLKQHLLNIHQKTPTICIEVSIGPNCLCGDLRSSSTLVSSQPCKRDVVLEQWTITIDQKRLRESSNQMSVTNLYQAVRSLLHFSQLTAWYMSNNGMKPANVIYRVAIQEDSSFICDDNFVSHDFPIAYINKTHWMKISVKTLPRMKTIPVVYCPQHSNISVDASSTYHFEGKEQPNREKSFLNFEPLHSEFTCESKEELLDNSLPLKFQGVRKKIFETQDRKRKKHITPYCEPVTSNLYSCSSNVFLDGLPLDVKKLQEKDSDLHSSKRMFKGMALKPYLGESSKGKSKNFESKFSTTSGMLVKPLPDFEAMESTYYMNIFEQEGVEEIMSGFKNCSDSKNKSDFRTKVLLKNSSDFVEGGSDSTKKLDSKTVMDILDDRMQISCAISGKHHCKWECEEELDLNNLEENVEKPKRRRSVSKARANDCCGDSPEKCFLGKFKELDCCKSDLSPPLKECERDESHLQKACSPKHSQSSKPLESPPLTIHGSLGPATQSHTPINKSLPLKETIENEKEKLSVDTEIVSNLSSQEDASQEEKKNLNWVKIESFESFKKGWSFSKDSAGEYDSDSGEESSDSQETSNPFLAAILRTTKKLKTLKKCDSRINNKLIENGNEELRKKNNFVLNKSTDSAKSYENKNVSEAKAKGDVCEKVQFKSPSKEITCDGYKVTGSDPDLKISRKKSSAVESLELNKESFSTSEFLSKDSEESRIKSLLNQQEPKSKEVSSEEFEFFDEENSINSNFTKTIPVPSAHDKLKFRRSLDSAAQLVFHRCSGLPLTSSPAPVRRNNSSFSFDSSLNSVSAIKSALFEPSNSLSSEDENESEGSLKSPASPGAWSVGSKQINYHSLSPLPLLGSFEESVLNGRLEPVSTVQGFTAELGASGSFCPRHLYLPVTVFFYTLGDNDKVSAPYLGHINLGKKGYNVPRSGTIQVTLFNPMRTVVKMFVVVYDLHDMPPNSHTFLRQRTLYVPASQKEATYTDKNETPIDQEDYHKYLRYLIHLRFVSGKSGKIYLHTDIRMVIFRKADEDTATALGNQCDGESYELRSHTHGPINPKFSPRR